MPIYEYKCKKCGEDFEILCSINDFGKKYKCPQCGSDEMEKEVSAFSASGSDGCCAPPSGSGFKFG